MQDAVDSTELNGYLRSFKTNQETKKQKMELDEDCARVVAEVKTKNCVKLKPVSWVLLVKQHCHVQNIHFKISACYRLPSIIIDCAILDYVIVQSY